MKEPMVLSVAGDATIQRHSSNATTTTPDDVGSVSHNKSSSNNNLTSISVPLVPRPRKRRTVPFPNTILDTVSLIRTLEELNLYGTKVLPIHILSFYQALHRQHYPPLLEFVHNYYTNEHKAQFEHSNSSRIKRTTSTTMSHNNLAVHYLGDDDEYDGESIVQADTTATTSNAGRVTDKNQPGSYQQQPTKNRISNKKNFNRMQLPKALLEFLQTTDQFVTLTSTVKHRKTSCDRTTTKLIIQLHDAQIIESVIMRYNRPKKGVGDAGPIKSTTGYGNGRASLCFCATGTMGLSGNLSMGEILEQIIHADRVLANEWNMRIEQHDVSNGNINPLPKLDLVRNVVFMGMGEPLDNYDNVVAACRALTDNRRWNIAHSRVTISTVGIVDKIRKLTEDLPEVNLAVSLHAPNQDMRTSIVPSAKRYPIEELIDALDNHMMTFVSKQRRHQIPSNENPQNGECTEQDDKNNVFTMEERTKESTRRRAMVEYVMLEGPTSSIEAAHQLGKLCEGRQLVVNLIPYNRTDVKDQLRCPCEDHMQLFRNVVASYGSFCTIRRTMGADIDSACGQLVTLENTRKGRVRSTDIEDTGESFVLGGVLNNHDDDNNVVHKVRRSTTIQNASTLTTDVVPDGLDTAFNLDYWVTALTIATIVSATSFVASACLFLNRRRR